MMIIIITIIIIIIIIINMEGKTKVLVTHEISIHCSDS